MPNDAWVPGPHVDEYVSAVSYPPETDRGAFLDRAPYTRLITHSTLDDLLAHNQRFGPLPADDDLPGPLAIDPEHPNVPPKRPWVYMGPGLFQDEDGLIHIRLSHTTHSRPGVTDYTGERDPRKVPLAIWTAPKPTLLVSDCNSVIIRNLSARFGGGRTIRLEASTDVQLDHLDVRAGPYGVQVGEDCCDTSISHCHVDGGMPPWFFRSDRKDGYDYRVGGVKQLNDLGSKTVKSLLYGSPSCVRTKITQCEFVNGHDLSLFGEGLEFSRNWISNLNDDALIIDGVKVDELRVFENVIERTLTVLSFAGTAVGGRVYVYRNLFDLRQPTRGIRPRPHDDTPVARFGHLFKTDQPDGPLDLFQNTVIVTRQSIGSSYSLYRDYRGAHPRRCFNNIFVALNPTPESDRPIAYLPNPNHRGDTDGNCYFRSGRTDANLLAYNRYRGELGMVKGGSFRDLDALRDPPSKFFIRSKGQYPPGFEAQSMALDPRFRRFGSPIHEPFGDDLRLAADSPARAAGVKLQGDLWEMDGQPLEAQPDIGCYRFGSGPLKVGVDGRKQFPSGEHAPVGPLTDRP